MPKIARVPVCHPERKHKGNGLCSSCYNAKRNAKYWKDNAEKIAASRARSRVMKPEMYAERRLKKEYGMTVADLEALLKAQGGKCAICADCIDMSNRHVDHCHITGHVRGALCASCNLGLGKFKDNAELLESAARYVKKPPTEYRAAL